MFAKAVLAKTLCNLHQQLLVSILGGKLNPPFEDSTRLSKYMHYAINYALHGKFPDANNPDKELIMEQKKADSELCDSILELLLKNVPSIAGQLSKVRFHGNLKDINILFQSHEVLEVLKRSILIPMYINILQDQPKWVASQVSYPLEFGKNFVIHEHIPNCCLVKKIDFRKFPKESKEKRKRTSDSELLLWSFVIITDGVVIHTADPFIKGNGWKNSNYYLKRFEQSLELKETKKEHIADQSPLKKQKLESEEEEEEDDDITTIISFPILDRILRETLGSRYDLSSPLIGDVLITESSVEQHTQYEVLSPQQQPTWTSPPPFDTAEPQVDNSRITEFADAALRSLLLNNGDYIIYRDSKSVP